MNWQFYAMLYAGHLQAINVENEMIVKDVK